MFVNVVFCFVGGTTANRLSVSAPQYAVRKAARRMVPFVVMHRLRGFQDIAQEKLEALMPILSKLCTLVEQFHGDRLSQAWTS